MSLEWDDLVQRFGDGDDILLARRLSDACSVGQEAKQMLHGEYTVQSSPQQSPRAVAANTACHVRSPCN